MEYEKEYQQIGNTHHYMRKTHNFKQTKTSLTDFTTNQAPAKPSSFDKSFLMNWIEQPISKPASPIIYDDFIYTDNITKKRIKMSDAKQTYETGRQVRKTSNSSQNQNNHLQERKKRGTRFIQHNSNSEFQKELIDLNECFLMLKSTQMFKLNSLRHKIFGTVDRTAKNSTRGTSQEGTRQEIIQGQINQMLSKKKKIRQILEDSVKEANISQFRKYYSDSHYKLNKKIVSMNKKVPNSFKKSNIEKIIETLTYVQKKQDNICTLLKKQVQDIEFPGEDKLRNEVIEYMRKQIRSNGQYLVTPEKKKVLFQQLYKNLILKSKEFEDQEMNFTENEIVNHSSNEKKFDDASSPSKIDTNIPSQKTILDPIVNQKSVFKENHWSKGLRKTVNLKKSEREKKKTEYLFSEERKEIHKKENTWVDLTYNKNSIQSSRLLKKQSLKPASQVTSFLNNFAFCPCQKNKQISIIKSKFQKNKTLKSTKLSLKQQRFLFLVENGLLFDVEKDILMNEDYLFIKDKNEDNLLHICAKNHFTEMFNFIVERYVKCGLREEMRERWGEEILRQKLFEKNKYNKNVFEVANLYQAEEISARLTKIKEEMDIRECNR